jgi:hypothetical protein
MWFILFAGCSLLVSCLVYFLALMVEAAHSSETLTNIYQTTRLYMPVNSTRHSHHYVNFELVMCVLSGNIIWKLHLLKLFSALLALWSSQFIQ